MNTRKDYERAAKMIGWTAREEGVSGSDITQFMRVFFKGDNPRFDAERFNDRVGQWYDWLCKRSDDHDPVFEGEYERTTVSEMRRAIK